MQKLDGKVADLENEKKDAKDETETLRKEQDDLLVLLADQDQKVDQYKAKLKVLGEEVSLWKIIVKTNMYRWLYWQ